MGLLMGLLMGVTAFLRFLHDGAMSFGICRASPYCHANVAQPWSSLRKTRGVAFLWGYGACLSRNLIRDDFREGDEDNNFSVFRVRQFTESPEPLH